MNGDGEPPVTALHGVLCEYWRVPSCFSGTGDDDCLAGVFNIAAITSDGHYVRM